MQIILASAKIMNTSSTQEVPLMSTPLFNDQAEKMALEMAQWSVDELSKKFHCSKAIAAENLLRFQNFLAENDKLPAILAYNGQAYQQLKAQTFSSEDLSYAQQHLFITSFLYGMLRPLDRIHPYRMDAKTKLEFTSQQTMFAYWRPLLTDYLIEMVKQDDGVLVHLATEEYEHLFDWKRVCREVKVIQPLFYIEKADQLKVVAIYAKRCRGAMTRFILQNQLQNTSQLSQFTMDNFQFFPTFGDELHPHFIWKQP